MSVKWVMPLVLAAAVSAAGLYGDDAPARAIVSREELVEVLGKVKGWAQQTVALRNAGLGAAELVAKADSIRAAFDPVIVLMATTDPPKELKRAAVLLLMATKGVELALWHYIYGGAWSYAASVEHGDALLKTALGELSAAETLFAS